MRIHHATAKKAKSFHIALSVEENEIVATSKDGVRLASGPQGNKVLEDAITKMTGKPAKGNRVAKDAVAYAREVAAEDPFEAAAKAEGWKKTRWGFRNTDDPENKPDAETWQGLCEELSIEVEDGEQETDEIEAEDGDEDEQEDDAGRSIVKAKYKSKYKPNKGTCGDDFALKFKAYLTVKTEEGDRIDQRRLEEFGKANDCWVPAYRGMLRHRSGPGLVRMNVSNRIRAKVRKDPKFKIVWPE